MLNDIVKLLKTLVALAQENNTRLLSNGSELRDIHNLLKDSSSDEVVERLRGIEDEQDKQTVILTKQTELLGNISSELQPATGNQPGLAVSQKIVFAIPQ